MSRRSVATSGVALALTAGFTLSAPPAYATTAGPPQGSWSTARMRAFPDLGGNLPSQTASRPTDRIIVKTVSGAAPSASLKGEARTCTNGKWTAKATKAGKAKALAAAKKAWKKKHHK